MTNDQFWRVLNGIRRPSLLEEVRGLFRDEGEDEPPASTHLQKRLKRLSDEELLSFATHFRQTILKLYRWDVWAAASIIEGGCGDDGFTDFCAGAISRGRTFVETALRHPDDLATLLRKDEDWIGDESFGYVAHQAIEARDDALVTKWVAMIEAHPYPENPAGEEWDFEEEALNAERMPKLWKKFGEV